MSCVNFIHDFLKKLNVSISKEKLERLSSKNITTVPAILKHEKIRINTNLDMIKFASSIDLSKEHQLSFVKLCKPHINLSWPKGLLYIQALTKEESKDLLKLLDEPVQSDILERKVQHYGYKYDYTLREPQTRVLKKIDSIPKLIYELMMSFIKKGYLKCEANQVIINYYEPGQGIAAHRDHYPIFDEEISTLSLGSTYNMILKHHSSHPEYDKDIEISVRLEIGSLLVLRKDARMTWTHEIKKVKNDVVDGQRIPRGKRTSLTFRTVNKQYI